MADDENKEAAEEGKGEAKSGGMIKMLGIGVGLIVVMIGGQIGTLILAKSVLPNLIYPDWMMALAPVEVVAETVAPDVPPPPPLYTRIDPTIVVSFQSGSQVRFLQVTLEAMARDQASIEAFELHSPKIRNNLLMLLGSQSLEDMATREGKERVRQLALEEVRNALAEDAKSAKIEDLYFTSFVVQ
jgi:flagellar FliL protein